MSSIPSDLKYVKSHEWLRVSGDTATVGITKYAAEKLGDIVFVELPETGRKVEKGAEAAVVESVKSANEVYAPVSGEVTDANGDLNGDPAQVNADPEGSGWFFKIKVSNKSEFSALMSEAQYAEYVKGL